MKNLEFLKFCPDFGIFMSNAAVNAAAETQNLQPRRTAPHAACGRRKTAYRFTTLLESFIWW